MDRLLLKKYVENFCEQQEAIEVEKWLASLDTLEDEELLQDLWKEDPEPISSQVVENALQNLLSRIHLSEEDTKKNTYHIFRKIMRIAGMILLPLLSAWVTYWIVNDQTEHRFNNYLEYKVTSGEKKEITLSDGTHIFLNAGTVLLVPEKFGEDGREVYLMGEAYFSVFRDTLRPFVVRTPLINVEVLGTEFNIAAYQQEHSVTTTLVRGSVRLTTNREDTGINTSVILSPSQQSYYSSDMSDFEITTVDTRIFTAWKEGILIFDDTPFLKVVTQLEKHFNIKIDYSAYKKKDSRFTVKFLQEESLEEVLTVLSRIGYFNYSIENNKIRIYE